MKFSYDEFDLSGVRTYPLSSRRSKSNAADFARPYVPGSGMRAWLDSLPRLLGAADFRAVVAAMRAAFDAQRGILWGLGAHVVKTGLGPVLIDLMERGYVSGLAVNGAVVIHDFEIALVGIDVGRSRRSPRAGTIRHGRRDRAPAERRDQRRRRARARASAARSRNGSHASARRFRRPVCSPPRRGSRYR